VRDRQDAHRVGGGVHAADLAVPVTTDAEMIAKWLADTSGRALIVATYDSAHRLAEGLRRAGQIAELVVRDETQRLGLATALLAEPEMLILDEPANGLDPEGVRWLRDLLRGFAADGGTVLVSSHILAEVAQTVQEVVIVDRGRLVTQARLADLTGQAGGLEDVFLRLTDSHREASR
jgi:ABC-2 type transport system ATP-binding protein